MITFDLVQDTAAQPVKPTTFVRKSACVAAPFGAVYQLASDHHQNLLNAAREARRLKGLPETRMAAAQPLEERYTQPR